MKRLCLHIAALLVTASVVGQDRAYVVEATAAAFAKTSSLVADQDAEARLLRRDGQLLIEAEVGGVSGYLVLDTGAPSLILSNTHFAHGPASEILTGATGSLAFTRATIDTLRVAGLRQLNVPAMVAELRFDTDNLSLPVLGLMGYAQLKDFPAVVSLRSNTFSFVDEIRDPGTTAQVLAEAETSNLRTGAYSFEMRGHLPVLTAQVGEESLDFAFDTGSGVNIIDASYFEQLSADFRGRPAKRLLAGIDAHPTEVSCALVRLTLLEDEAHRDRPFLFSNLAALQDPELGLSGILSPAFWRASEFVVDYANATVTIVE